jgi:translation initiation factor IF-3
MYLLNTLAHFPDEAIPLEHEEKSSKKEKEVKTVMLKNTIADHDALSKIKNMRKMIEKGHTVRVMIGNPGEKGKAVSTFSDLKTTWVLDLLQIF